MAPTITQHLERMAHDMTSGPGLVDSIEVALIGGVLGGAVGYAKDRNSRGAKSFALWGAGLGVAGQFLIFHMLKSVVRNPRSIASVHPPGYPGLPGHLTGAVNRGGYGGNGGMPFGPGPWPTKGAAPPDSNMQAPDPARLDPNAMMTGWGEVGAPPYGRAYSQLGEWW